MSILMSFTFLGNGRPALFLHHRDSLMGERNYYIIKNNHNLKPLKLLNPETIFCFLRCGGLALFLAFCTAKVRMCSHTANFFTLFLAQVYYFLT